MSNLEASLEQLITFDGAICAGIVDYTSGMLLGSRGSAVDMEIAAAGNTEVIRAKIKTMKSLGMNDHIEDILITLGRQYHILRPSETSEGLFVYYVLDSARANLALARRKVQDAEGELKV